MSFALINNQRLHYKWINFKLKQKDSTVLIFLHEGLGSIPQWRDFPELISNNLQMPALVYERLGHGESDPIIGNRLINYMHREAWEVLPEIFDYLDIRSQIIPIGHSDGGSISLLYSAKNAKKVKAIVSIAAHALVEDCTVKNVEDTVKLYEDFDLRYVLEKFHGKNADSMFYGWANAWLSPDFKYWNIEKEISKITSPLLIIQGDNDEYATIKQVDAIEKAVSGKVERFIVNNCGHIPHLQKKELVIKKIIDFIKTAD